MILDMTPALESLPDDVERLKEMVREQRTLLAARDIEAQRARIEIDQLRLQLAKLRRLKFGRSSEKIAQQIEQLELLLEELETSEAQLPAAQLSMLLEGIDWRRPERAWRPERAA